MLKAAGTPQQRRCQKRDNRIDVNNIRIQDLSNIRTLKTENNDNNIRLLAP
jgi:hypothetical protein